MAFKAVVINKTEDSVYCEVTTLDENALPEGDVLVDVEFSTINYKDGLVIQGLGNLVKNYPHVPGIDFSGTVSASNSDKVKVGDKVVLTGWRVGEIHWGGLAEKARVKSDWLITLPSNVTTRDAMAIGTAGLTAMLGVMELEYQGLTPEKGPVLVTGASGGVGSVATRILADLGYQVTAVSGKPEMTDYLKSLGASDVLSRDEFAEPSKRPLESAKWAGCIDAVGGNLLSRVIPQMQYGGVIAAIGNAGGIGINTTVIPFLLRAVKLIGIDSVMAPIEKRKEAWERLASGQIASKISAGVTEIGLADVGETGKKITSGKIAGRILVRTS